MIKIRVTEVDRKSSVIHRTSRFNEVTSKYVHTQGAEWEIVHLASVEPEGDEIIVANINGNVTLLDGAKLMISEPKLFGTFKPGDIIELRVVAGGTPINPETGYGG